MSVSRDEAREVAILGILITIVVRIGAGVFQLIEELDAEWTLRSLAGRFFAPIGSTVGILALAAVMIVVLSPKGSVTPGIATACQWMAGLVASLGILATFHVFFFSFSDTLAKIWFVMINGMAAGILGSTGYWILKNFDADR